MEELSNNSALDKIGEVPIWKKLNLTFKEAAMYSGIGENKLRELSKSPNCKFVIRNGSKTLIKRKEFEEYNQILRCI